MEQLTDRRLRFPAGGKRTRGAPLCSMMPGLGNVIFRGSHSEPDSTRKWRTKSAPVSRPLFNEHLVGHLRVKHQSCVGSAWALLLHHRCVPQRRTALSCPHLDQAHSSPTQAHLPALPRMHICWQPGPVRSSLHTLHNPPYL